MDVDGAFKILYKKKEFSKKPQGEFMMERLEESLIELLQDLSS